MFNGDYVSIRDYFTEEYKKDEINYLKGLIQQSIIMYNALSYKIGNGANLKYNEEFFYINEQMKESGYSIREYLLAVDKNGEFRRGLGVKEDIDLYTNYYMMNPMYFASIACSNKGVNYDDRNVAVFDYDSNRKLLYAMAIKENSFDKVDAVALTNLEQARLSNGRAKYVQAIKNLNKEEAIYEIEPVVSPASSLVAGKLKDSKKQGITDYINVIRVGAGLQELTAGEEEFNVAQHISTLMSYRYLSLGLGIRHQPEKPQGVTDDYYKIAIGWGKGYAENLGFSATQTSIKNMMKYINMFVDDTAENPRYFSHRQKVLNAGFTTFGFGISPQMFSNEFSGYKANNTYLEAWPSANGITFMETLYNARFEWTAQFTDKYKIQETTTATIKCLNTDDTWEFNQKSHTSNYWFQCDTNTISTLNNKVVMYNSNIIPKAGNVYEITLHNIIDEATGKSIDYVYRTVFEYADENNYAVGGKSISINADNLEKNNDGTYNAIVDETKKLNAKVDTTVSDRKITWISSDEDIISVTQNGTINVNKVSSKPVTITVYYDNNYNVSSSVTIYTIEEQIILGDVNKDGKVNGKDWNMMYEYINETIQLSNEQLKVGDVNKDGKVNGKDWNRLYEHINEINPLF